jgi:hypothetical protein
MNQPIRVVNNEPYGARAALEAAQHAIPLPNEGGAPSAAAPPSPAAAPATAAPEPPALAGAQPFNRPTERPAEPVTAGLPSGPGPGPEALSTMTQQAPDLIGAQLKAIFAQYPNDDLLRVMALHEAGH